MKVLFLSQGREIADHPGWNDALTNLRDEGEISDFLNIPYFGYAGKHGWNGFYNEVIKQNKKHNFDVIYFHYFHERRKPSPRLCIETLIKLKNPPVIITSCGDGFSDNWMMPDYPDNFKEASRLADITFSTQMGKAADKMIRWGAKNIVYSPNSMCQVRFSAQRINLSNHQFDFDVVFVGSKNSTRLINPLSKFWWGAQQRDAIVSALHKRHGKKLGLFGNGWKYSSAQGPTLFDEQQSTFRRGRIIVGGNPYSYADYYSSNRLFFEISSGIPTVELAVPRLDRVLRNNDHLYLADDIPQLINTVDKLLESSSDDLYHKAEKAAQFIAEKHTQYHRMKFKIDTVKRYIQNNKKLDVNFPYFLPETDLNKEQLFAIREK